MLEEYGTNGQTRNCAVAIRSGTQITSEGVLGETVIVDRYVHVCSEVHSPCRSIICFPGAVTAGCRF